MRCLFAALITAVAVIAPTSYQCLANDFTDEELKAAAAVRSLAIQAAAKKVTALEKAQKNAVLSDQRKEALEKVKQARREYNSIKNKSPEDFAAEARNQKADTPADEAKQLRDAVPDQARPRNNLQDRAEEIRQEREARMLAQAEAMKGLVVKWPYLKVWVPNKGTTVEYGVCDIRFNDLPPTQGFFQVGDETEAVLVESSDPTVVEPVKDERHIKGPDFFRFAKPGVATVTVRLGGYSVAQAIEVKDAPVAVGDQTSIVIEKMGLPSAKPSIYVRWPDAKEHDCFFYNPDAGKPFIGEHWFYSDYPGLVLSVTEGRVEKLGTNRGIKDHQIELKMREPKPE